MGYEGRDFLRALEASHLHWKTKTVGFAMAVHGQEGSGKCIVSITDLALSTGLSVWSVERGLVELAAAGFLAGEQQDADRYADHETLHSEVEPAPLRGP